MHNFSQGGIIRTKILEEILSPATLKNLESIAPNKVYKLQDKTFNIEHVKQWSELYRYMAKKHIKDFIDEQKSMYAYLPIHSLAKDYPYEKEDSSEESENSSEGSEEIISLQSIEEQILRCNQLSTHKENVIENLEILNGIIDAELKNTEKMFVWEDLIDAIEENSNIFPDLDCFEDLKQAYAKIMGEKSLDNRELLLQYYKGKGIFARIHGWTKIPFQERVTRLVNWALNDLNNNSLFILLHIVEDNMSNMLLDFDKHNAIRKKLLISENQPKDIEELKQSESIITNTQYTKKLNDDIENALGKLNSLSQDNYQQSEFYKQFLVELESTQNHLYDPQQLRNFIISELKEYLEHANRYKDILKSLQSHQQTPEIIFENYHNFIASSVIFHSTLLP